jgi:SPP1 family predicted phage head-tail adaptor
MSLAAGEFNRKFRINKRTGLKDALNRPIAGDWVEHREVWGDLRSPSGLSVVQSGVRGSDAPIHTHNLRIRYATDILINMQAVEISTGDTFDIVDVRPDYKNREFTDLILKSGNSG